MTIDYSNLHQMEAIPTYLKKFHLAQIDEFDNEWMPMFMRFMPKQSSPGLDQGGSGKQFSMPWIADPQAMARYHDPREQVKMMADPHVDAITFNCRTIKNGFAQDLEEFEGDFAGGVIAQKRRMMDKNLVKNINRTIEYTLTRYVYGDPVVMGAFSNQGLERYAYANIRAGTFRGVASAQLGGQQWGFPAANIFRDINWLKDRYELMSGELPEFMALGRATVRNMENNDGLLDRLIHIKDTTQGLLGSAIQGLKITRVVGQTYKDVPGINVNEEGYPGKGDYLRQTWDRLNKIEMMTQVGGGHRWEWGLMANRSLGFVACAWTHKLHQQQRVNPTEMFSRSFVEHDPLEIKNVAEITVCPVVNDFAYALRLDQTSIND